MSSPFFLMMQNLLSNQWLQEALCHPHLKNIQTLALLIKGLPIAPHDWAFTFYFWAQIYLMWVHDAEN